VAWYTWLEQGRDIRVSPETLDRIATALRLTPTDTAYLFSLSGVPRAETMRDERKVELGQGVQSILDAFRAPAFVVGSSWDVEAFNEVADRVFRFKDGSGAFARNHMWRFFMDPARRAVYLDWNQVAETAVGVLRAAYAGRVGAPYFDSLVRALTEGSAEFKKLWSAQQTAPLTPERVRLSVPEFGELHVTATRLRLPDADDCLLILLPPADERSASVLARMARDLKPQLKRAKGAPRARGVKPHRSRS
jgi:PAS domain-containing protein